MNTSLVATTRRWSLAVFVILAGGVLWQASADGQAGALRDPARELDITLIGPFTLASVGALIIMRPCVRVRRRRFAERADDYLGCRRELR